MKISIKKLFVSAVALLSFCVANAASSDVISSVTWTSGTTFTIKRTTTTYPTTVYYRTCDGSAVGGIHYQEAYGSIEFPAGVSEKTVTITKLTPPESSIYAYGSSAYRYFRLEVWNSCTSPKFASCTLSDNIIVSKSTVYDEDVYKGTFSTLTYPSTRIYTAKLSDLKDNYSKVRKNYLAAYGVEPKYAIRAEFDLYELSGTATTTSWWYVYLHNMSSAVYTIESSSSVGAGRLRANFGHANPSTVNGRGEYLFPVAGVTNSTSLPMTNPWNHTENDQLWEHKYGYEDDAYYNSYNGKQYVRLYNGSEYASVELVNEILPSGQRYSWSPFIYMCLIDVYGNSQKSINVNTGITYTSGDKVWLAISFPEVVVTTTTSFSIPVTIDGATCDFSYCGGSGTNTLYFTGTPTITTSTCVTSCTIPFYNTGKITDWFGNKMWIDGNTAVSLKIGQKYTVTLNTNGGGTINCGDVKYYTYSIGATLPTNVTRTGYTFGGWYENSSCTGSKVTTISTTATGNKTYYAKWTANKYTVTLDSRGATSSGTASVTATYASAMPSITTPIKIGYTFGGYYDEVDGGGYQYYNSSGSSARNYNLTSSVTLYAKWTIKKPTVTFNNQGATSSGTASATATYGSAMPSITIPQKTGYTFGGYFTAINGGGTQYYLASGASAMDCDFESAKTLYAKWTANTYTITYNNQFATSSGTTSATATYNEKLPVITAPAKTGYTFQGYYWGTNGTSTKYYNADGSANLNMFTRTAATTLYAYWTKDTYTITYVNNGGTISGTPKSTYQYGDAAITLPSIQRDGCSFGGWYDNANCEGTAITSIPEGSLGDKTFYAKWTPNTYTVTLYPGEGSISSGNITSYVYGVGAILPLSSVMVNPGFGFAGWYDNDEYNGDAVSEITVADFGNKKYWAKWEEGSYPVVLNTNEGVVNSGNVVSYKHGTAKTLPTDVTRTGYIFEGWYDNSSCLGMAVTEISSESVESKTFWAKWREQVYDVTFETNGGTINNEVVIDQYTFSVGGTLPADVTRNGYSFLGWYDNEDLLGNPVALIRSSDYGDKTYYAKWSKNTYTVSYNNNGGYIEDEEIVTSYSIGDEFDLPMEVYKDGYTFRGWYDNSNFDNEPIDYVDSDEFGNKTYYAKWVVNSYSVTFTTNGGVINSGIVSIYTYGYGVTLPVDVTRTGYTFAGWYSDASFTSNRYLSIAEDETGSKTFYAKWTENTYSITMNVNDGNIKSENVSSYTYGTSVTLPTNVVRDGYTFGGWYENSNFDGAPVKTVLSTSTGNKTYYAKWVVNTYSVVLDADGGQINAGNVLSYTYGVGAILPTNVTKTGYSFEGWEVRSGSSRYRAILKTVGSEKMAVLKKVKEMLGLGLKEAKDLIESAPQILEEDITLEAAQIYKDALESLGSEVVIEATSGVEKGTILAAISSGTIGDLELVALWKQNEYLITYNANGGLFSETPTTNYVYGDEVTLPTPTYTGYTFGGWYDNSNFTGSSISTITESEYGDKDYWAKWDVEVYDVVFETNEGEINAGIISKYTYDVLAVLPYDVTRVGYKFLGWYNNADFEGEAMTVINKGTTGNQTFYAKWEQRVYNVILVTNEGIINEGNVETYAYGEGATLPTNVTKDGYSFEGWYGNSSYTGGAVTSIANNDSGDKQFWAKWTINTYDVVADYDKTMGVVTGEGSYEHKSMVTLKAVANDGYEFLGWNDGITDKTIQFVATKDSTVIANFKEKEKVVVAGSLEIPTLKTEREAEAIDLTGMFTSTEGGEIVYSATSSVPNVVSATVSEGKLYLTVYEFEGEAEITVTGTLANGEKNSVKATAVVELACNIKVAESIKNVSCYGESDGEVALKITNAAEPYTIQWTGETFTTDTIINLVANNYTINIEDAEGCTFQKTYTVTQPEEMTMKATVKNPTCSNADGSISLDVTGGEAFTFAWNNEATTQNLANLAKGTYSLTVTNEETGCKVSDTYELTEPDAPVISVATIVETACNESNGAVYISTNNDNLIYKWSNSRTTKNLTGVRAGDYSLEVVDENNCTASLNVTVPSIPLKQPEIALVTVSEETGKNLVVWLKENTDLIDYYTIYRENDEGGVYEKVETVSYNELSVYEDLEADPNLRPWRYKISATDVCGTETEKSAPHMTMHITKNAGAATEENEKQTNLIWNSYEGLDFSTFVVMCKHRENNKIVVDTLTTLPSTINSYTVDTVIEHVISYYVGIKLPEEINPKTQFLKAESGPFSLAISNIAEAENEEDIPDAVYDLESTVLVYAAGHTIYVKNAEGKNVSIYDNNGRCVSQTNDAEAENEFTVRLDGIYFVTVGGESFKVMVR